MGFRKDSGTEALVDPKKSSDIKVDMKVLHMGDDPKATGSNCFSYFSLAVFSIFLILLTIFCIGGVDKYIINHDEDYFRGRLYVASEDIPDTPEMLDVSQNMRNFYEDVNVNLSERPHVFVEVPSFPTGKGGRFVHDFSTNMTAIVDVEAERCFVMPLDRNAVLPPHSLVDAIKKMMNGYYNVNMTLVRRNMRVIIPPLSDLTNIGDNILSQCVNYPIYALEKYMYHVNKRSVDNVDVLKFREFAGNTLQEFDIVNLAEIIQYEQGQKKGN